MGTVVRRITYTPARREIRDRNNDVHLMVLTDSVILYTQKGLVLDDATLCVRRVKYQIIIWHRHGIRNWRRLSYVRFFFSFLPYVVTLDVIYLHNGINREKRVGRY